MFQLGDEYREKFEPYRTFYEHNEELDLYGWRKTMVGGSFPSPSSFSSFMMKEEKEEEGEVSSLPPLPPPSSIAHLPNTPTSFSSILLRRDVLPEVAGTLLSGTHPGQELPHREGPWTHLDRLPGTQGAASPLPPQVSRGVSSSILIPHSPTVCMYMYCA